MELLRDQLFTIRSFWSRLKLNYEATAELSKYFERGERLSCHHSGNRPYYKITRANGYNHYVALSTVSELHVGYTLNICIHHLSFSICKYNLSEHSRPFGEDCIGKCLYKRIYLVAFRIQMHVPLVCARAHSYVLIWNAVVQMKGGESPSCGGTEFF
jgi:hypothetical protein